MFVHVLQVRGLAPNILFLAHIKCNSELFRFNVVILAKLRTYEEPSCCYASLFGKKGDIALPLIHWLVGDTKRLRFSVWGWDIL